MKTSIWTVAAVVILVSAVTAWLGFNSANATRAALADGSTKCTALAAEITRAPYRMAIAGRTLADLRADLKMAQAEAEKQSAAASSAKPSTVSPPARWEVMEAHPELRGLFRQNFRASMRLVDYYPFFYKAAGLTPEQIQKFEELMTEDAEQAMDLEATASAQGLTRTDPAIAKMRQQTVEKLKAAQTELLGAAAYQQLQDFNRAKPQYPFVSTVVAEAALISAPLTEAQREQLSSVLATSVRDSAVAPANPTGNLYVILSKTTDWSRALAQAQTFLSPTQLSAFKAQMGNVEAWALVREFWQREGIPAGK